MSTPARKLALAATICLIVLLLFYGAAHWVVGSEGFRTRLQSEMREKTGYEVRFEELRLTPWLGVVASGIAVSEDGKVLFEASRVVCFLWPLDYFNGRISRLYMEQPVLHVALADLLKTSGKKTPQFSIGALAIEDGKLVLETGRTEPFVLGSIYLSGQNVSLAGETGLQLRTRLPAIEGAAALAFSGSIDEMRADIAVFQGEQTRAPVPREEKAVFEASFKMKAKPDGGYEVAGSGGFDGFRIGAETIDGRFHSLVEIDAELDILLFSADLKMPQLPLKLFRVDAPVASGAVTATLRGRHSLERRTLTFTAIKATTGLGNLEGEGTVSFAALPARLANTVRIRDVPLDAVRAFLPDPLGAFSYSGKLAAELNLSGAYNEPLIKGLAWSDRAVIEGKELSISDLSLKIPFEWAAGFIQAEDAILRGKNLLFGRKGETQIKLEAASLAGGAVKEQGKPVRIDGDFEISEGRFSNPKESRIGENLAGKGHFSYTELEGNPVFNGRASVSRLELLWDKFFGDFADQRPSFEFDGSYRRSTGELRFDRLRVSLASAGYLDLSGSVRHLLAEPEFDLQVESDDLRYESLYEFFIRETFKTSYPMLGEIGLVGKSDLAFRARGSLASFTLEGNLRLQQGEIRARSGEWHVGPVALNLPVKVRFPEAAKGPSGEKPAAGRLSIRQIKTRSTSIPEIGGPVVLWNNALRFPEPIQVRLFGGSASIQGLSWKDIVGAPREVSFSLRLDDLRLLELTRSLGWHPFSGNLSGSIPQVRWTENSFKSDGVITLDAFGGRAAIRGMEIENPLSPVRSIRMDAILEDLNLEQVSETFEFGRISGILAGTIRDLVFTQGQPAEFKADIRTVDRRDVSQWISVEALHQITVISSGNEAGAVYGGLASFFDFFRYSKLGFKATLKNDKLILRGVESKDGKEYLVVGTFLPPTVNIISHTQEIGFSELLRRLETIQKDGSPKSPALP